jgi:hypothetical protein
MDCDWLFVNQDRSRVTATLLEPTLPQLGDGKRYGGRGYEVVLVITNLVAQPNPLVVGFEFAQKS